jgi:TetR/AcrR family transcriptional regulator, cholesterol catabolism regulator
MTLPELLDTAATLFWEKGYAATTTREIAAALEIQQASLYYHVSSKEALLHQLCVASLQQFLADVPKALEDAKSPKDRVLLLIRAHIATLLKNQSRNVTMLTELRSLSRPHRAEVEELRRQYTDVVRTTLEEAQASGDLRDDISAAHLSLALLNILNWSALWFRKNRALSQEQWADLCIKVFLEGAATQAEAYATEPPNLPKAKKPKDHQENPTVKRLLRAAVGLFSKKGYTATSTREVAALLGIQKASLYYHIDGKEDLLYFICKSSLERIRADVEAAVDPITDPLERTRTLICAHLESMLRDIEEHTTTLAEMHALSTERRNQVFALRDRYEHLVQGLLEAGQKSGAIRADIEAKYLRLILLGLLNRVVVWYRRSGTLSSRDLGLILANIFLSGAAARS